MRCLVPQGHRFYYHGCRILQAACVSSRRRADRADKRAAVSDNLSRLVADPESRQNLARNWPAPLLTSLFSVSHFSVSHQFNSVHSSSGSVLISLRSLSIYLSIYPSIYLSLSEPVSLHISVSPSVWVSLSIHQSIHQSIKVSIHVFESN